MLEQAKEKANQRVKSATKEADEILKELRELRDKKIRVKQSFHLFLVRLVQSLI